MSSNKAPSTTLTSTFATSPEEMTSGNGRASHPGSAARYGEEEETGFDDEDEAGSEKGAAASFGREDVKEESAEDGWRAEGDKRSRTGARGGTTKLSVELDGTVGIGAWGEVGLEEEEEEPATAEGRMREGFRWGRGWGMEWEGSSSERKLEVALGVSGRREEREGEAMREASDEATMGGEGEVMMMLVVTSIISFLATSTPTATVGWVGLPVSGWDVFLTNEVVVVWRVTVGFEESWEGER
jgi:hypothetical protein